MDRLSSGDAKQRLDIVRAEQLTEVPAPERLSRSQQRRALRALTEERGVADLFLSSV
jgi:hypothetical protein